MAYANSTRTAEAGVTERLFHLVASMKDTLRRRRVYNTTMRELRNLSDRDLSDLGIHRTMIREVAHEAAYGK